GKRNAGLNRIGAGARESFDDAHGRIAIRVSAGDVGNQSAASLLAEALEKLRQPAHRSSAATWGTSLSPRPERFTMTIASRLIERPLRSSQPSACADSSAGMIPSLSLSA